MKKSYFLFTAVITLTAVTLISSCGPKCAWYHSEVMGIKTPSQQYCGDALKQVENNPNFIKDEPK